MDGIRLAPRGAHAELPLLVAAGHVHLARQIHKGAVAAARRHRRLLAAAERHGRAQDQLGPRDLIVVRRALEAVAEGRAPRGIARGAAAGRAAVRRDVAHQLARRGVLHKGVNHGEPALLWRGADLRAVANHTRALALQLPSGLDNDAEVATDPGQCDGLRLPARLHLLHAALRGEVAAPLLNVATAVGAASGAGFGRENAVPRVLLVLHRVTLGGLVGVRHRGVRALPILHSGRRNAACKPLDTIQVGLEGGRRLLIAKRTPRLLEIGLEMAVRSLAHGDLLRVQGALVREALALAAGLALCVTPGHLHPRLVGPAQVIEAITYVAVGAVHLLLVLCVVRQHPLEDRAVQHAQDVCDDAALRGIVLADTWRRAGVAWRRARVVEEGPRHSALSHLVRPRLKAGQALLRGRRLGNVAKEAVLHCLEVAVADLQRGVHKGPLHQEGPGCIASFLCALGRGRRRTRQRGWCEAHCAEAGRQDAPCVHRSGTATGEE
mmetsp:Transcript_47206/g.145350  ORF Transcript_47206/g.145350 Transcript_47206/m.145350 type:complete len:494 (-) Transcript_47206:49-1530(-)